MATETDWRTILTSAPCRECGVAGRIEYSLWESDCGGFEDAHYRCLACGADWWVDGPDA